MPSSRKVFRTGNFILTAVLFWAVALIAHEPALKSAPADTVPQLVNFAGKAVDEGKPVTGAIGLTFAIYKDQFNGVPLWTEVQNAFTDANGNYSVQLGSSSPTGLPLELFISGEARWLGVRVNGGAEQARVLLLSVPYALKAADAQTLGGLPPSAFLQAASTINVAGGNASTSPESGTPSGSRTVTTAGGTAKTLAKFDSSTDIANSQIFDDGTNVGIGTSSPQSKLDVKGTVTVRGALRLPATGTATASSGKHSEPEELTASAFNSLTTTAVSQKFRWQAEPVRNNTDTASGSLNLLFAQGSSSLSETGLSIASNGQLTFASGQTFPGVGSVTSVGLSAPGSDFTVHGSPITHSGSISLGWVVPPRQRTQPTRL